MKKIQKIVGTVTAVQDLSATARDVEITLTQPLGFTAGAFVNVFIEHDGQILRRAFSVSSSDQEQNVIALSIRQSLNGMVSPLFWQKDIIGTQVSVMGPLGLNTADLMQSKTIYLFGFGVGAGVVKSLTDHFDHDESVTRLVVVMGHRSRHELLHKTYFDQVMAQNSKVFVEYVVSQTDSDTHYKQGYIQNHVAGYDFSNSDVYICGQTVACTALKETILSQHPTNCNFFIEDFH